MLRRYGGFAPLELFSFAAISGLIDTALRAEESEMAARRWISGGYEKTMSLDSFRAALSASPETRFGQEKTAEEIDRELAEKFNGVKFRRAALDEVKG